MSTLDPAKLKVVELRQELTARGLDAKGNKPVLVKRLKEALEKELEQEIPDTSIADTSTEEQNTSQESVADEVQSDPPDKGDAPAVVEEKPDSPPSKIEEPEPVEQEQKQPEPPVEPAEVIDNSTTEVAQEVQEEAESIPKDNVEDVQMAPVEENGENVDHEMQDDSKPDKVADTSEPSADGPETKAATEEPRGEKRRRNSPSPERVQRKRSKSPIKEDEPIIDNNKVQLSWYDSDLHLVVDKKSFLSGKPYHEGAFGYAWAGVRATHGAKLGKVCYEVKITEELKWEDPVKQSEKKRDRHDGSKKDRQRSSSKPNRENSRSSHDNSKSKDSKDKEEKEKAEDSNKEESKDDNSNSESVEDKIQPEDVKMEKSEIEKEENSENSEVAAEKSEVTSENDQSNTENDENKVESDKNKEEKSEESAANESEKKEEKQEPMEVDETPIEPIAKHLFRVGWSLVDTCLQLGEAEYSYGYESSGKFVTNKEFSDYGIKFGVGDVIGAYLDIGDEFVIMNFTVNGVLQPQATSIPRSDLPEENLAFFPHVLTRNCAFELNPGSQEEPHFSHPAELSDYAYLENVEDKQAGPVRPEVRNECEVIMMCGLPAAGKTEWVRKMVKENPDKRFTVIGNSHLLEKMTVNGSPLKNSYKGRWNVVLDRLMKCVNVLVETAALRRRNFVIDQTNVFPSAQRRKMRLFEGFKRRAVVVVVGDEEQAKRRALQEAQDGKDVPDSAILEMKANMSLPRRGDWLEEVTYVELGEDEAKTLVQKYNQQGREAGFGPISGQRSGYHRDNRGHPYRWDHSTSRRDYRAGYRDNRSYQNNRYDRSRQHGWQNRRPPPGSWNRDVRRERGPGGSRDFRNNNRSSGGRQDRSGNRDSRSRNQNSSNYRNQRSQSNRNQPANWQGGSGSGSWQNQSWGSSQGMWNQGGWGQSGWNGGGGQAQWKGGYSQSGYGQGGYGNYANWNYYGQYPQNWNSQGQPHTTTAGGTAATDSMNPGYNQYSQQAAWAQYAQQYAQQGQTYTSSTTSSTATTQQSSTQK
ncbi:hypothetical protein ILUMI_23607 [Ignelater luminosus]|uniref:SAP domain-containing protein n=1 Tax=Ignelater luminosus TaxID=2038154 RepID=A0A8K0C7T8_IGNLU|nr:hypothetical protein ILUMI_23607 [Ignelater luminosus]